ncbi:MAG TPA: AAA domain-containing protein, partial [Methanomassiliicoccaceae archaeon]|nr:AAA domain-containing protein [Methanomassiliicoccaceae archaeon]
MVSTGNYLGLFSFAKMVMYEELTAYRDLALEHPVVRALAGCPTELPSAGSISPEELDGGDDPSEIFQVLDADSSQQEAIALARKGVSFVLQGPPGTGKSQTIANIIAETLAKEKTVLFVSEKMAALEVVKRRLDERGLGDYCLELHSHKASRQEVAAELGRCLHPKAASVVETASLEELASLRKRLNDHVEALHEIRPGAGISFHRINSELISLRSVPDLPVHFPNLHDMSVKDLEGIGPLAREVERDMHLLRKGHQHPWRDCILDSWKVSALPELEGLLTSSRDALEDALRRSSALAERFGMHAPATLSQSGSLIDHLRLAIDSPRPRANWFKEP